MLLPTILLRFVKYIIPDTILKRSHYKNHPTITLIFFQYYLQDKIEAAQLEKDEKVYLRE